MSQSLVPALRARPECVFATRPAASRRRFGLPRPRFRRCRRSTPAACWPTSRCCRRTSSKDAAPGSKGEELTVKFLQDAFTTIALSPGNTDGTFIQPLPPGGRHHRHQHEALDDHRQREKDDVPLARRCRGLDQARRRHVVNRELGDDLRRLRRDSFTEYNWDNFKDVDVKGRADPRARQRPADTECLRPVAARRHGVQRQGDDLLRPLDLQVRGRRPPRRGRHPDRPRDRSGRVSVHGRPGQPRREV